MGVVPPLPGFNAALRDLAHENGALLILDEVMTGFRVSRKRMVGLEARRRRPVHLRQGDERRASRRCVRRSRRRDGPPCAGRSRLPSRHPVRQPARGRGGTRAAARCTDDVYAAVDKTALAVSGIVTDALTAAGVVHRVNTAGNLFSFFFTDDEVVDYATAEQQDAAAYNAFFHAMLDRGVYLPPSAYEAWFVGASHDDDALAADRRRAAATRRARGRAAGR